MRRLGLRGARRGKTVRTTVADRSVPCPLDRVNRQFTADRPNQLWVSDFTYVSTWQGWLYVASLGSTPFPRTVLKRRIASCLERPLYVAFLGYGTALCNRIHRPWLHPKFDIGGGGPVLA